MLPLFVSLILAAHAHPEGLTLEQAVELAVTRNERTAIATEQVQAAQAQLARARAFFFPELAVNGSYTRRQNAVVREVGGTTLTVQSADALSATANLRWPVLDPRNFPLYRSARLSHDASRYDEVQTRRQVGFEAADAFLLTLSADQVHQAAVRRMELAQKSLAEARARFEARLVSVNDVTRVELELATAQREVTRTDGDLRLTVVQLGFLLNKAVPAVLQVPSTLLAEADAANPSEEKLVGLALVQRPDLTAALERARAADALALEPRLRLLPALSLRGTYRLTNEPGIVGRISDGSAGADLTWVLFDQGLRYADADERDAQARISHLNARLLERSVGVDVQAAMIDLARARGALAQAQVAARAAEKNSGEVAELYRQGLASALDVSDAAAQLFEAEVSLARERYGLARAFLSLRAATGLDPMGNEVKP